MSNRISLWFNNHRNIINIVRFTLISFVLLLITWLIDIRYVWLKEYIPDLFLLSAEVSNAFLSNLSGVFLTVTTFTFTTILTVVSNYSSNFTPRVVQKFINKPNVLSLFGIFVGGFFYTVLSLFFLQNIDLDQPVLSGTLGILYAVASMIYFVLFVKRVLQDIKAENLISDIYDEAEKLIAVEADLRKKSERWSEEKIVDTYQLYSRETGYFYGIDYDRAFSLIEDLQCELIIHKKIGEYVPKGVYIANLNVQKKEVLASDETLSLFEKVGDCFIMNVSQNETFDYHHEITNLVEIALRAISPGINDPNTAVICLRRISLLLGQLFSSENQFIVARQNHHAKVIYESYSVEEELYLSFYQIIF